MKKMHLLFFASLLFLNACKKQDAEQPAKETKLSFKTADQIPNEIIPLLYRDLIKTGLTEQAENLRYSYYQTLMNRKDDQTDLLNMPYYNSNSRDALMGASLPTRSVANVGVVLDGNWYNTNGNISEALVQDNGWISTNFNSMNGTAPDAFSSTSPGAGQYLGSVGISKRMQAFRIATVQYGVTDDLGTTYFTPSTGFTYDAFCQDLNWTGFVSSPSMAGTLLPKRIEAVKIRGPHFNNSNTITFNDPSPSTEARIFVYYRAHVQNNSWNQSWKAEDEVAGTTGQALRLEALQIRAYLIKI